MVHATRPGKDAATGRCARLRLPRRGTAALAAAALLAAGLVAVDPIRGAQPARAASGAAADVPGHSDAVAAGRAARASGHRVEVTDARSARDTTYANPDGTFTLEQLG